MIEKTPIEPVSVVGSDIILSAPKTKTLSKIKYKDIPDMESYKNRWDTVSDFLNS